MSFFTRRHRGKDGQTFYVLNGDRDSVTTSQVQSNVRGAIGNRLRVIVPFSALESAGIDRTIIRILDVTDHEGVQRA